MSLFSATLDPLTAAPGRRPSGARLYHRGSRFGPPERCKLNRNMRVRLFHLAKALDHRTRQKGQHGGILKQTGIRVLNELLFRFLNMKTGECFPSHDAIAQAAGCCIETVRKAIRALEAAGIIATVRRKIVATFTSRPHRVRFDVAVQTSNSYVFNVPLPDRSSAGDLALPLLNPRKAARSEADATKWHETDKKIKSKSSAPVAGLIQPCRMPIETPETNLAAEKARWLAVLLGTDKAG